MSNIGQGRALKVCDICGLADDHPRHEFAGSRPGVQVAAPPAQEAVDRLLDSAPKEHRARLLSELMDTSTGQRHYDCCRDAGCPTGLCDVLTNGAEGKRGADLEKHIAKLRSRSANVFDDRDDVVWANTDEGQG